MSDACTFSIVIATRNRRALLARTLDAIDRQAWPRDRVEIVVVDNGSTDDTGQALEEAAARLPNLRRVFVEAPGKSAAVNEGLSHSTGGFIALTDDDVQPDPMWLARLAETFEETGADFIAGRVLPVWECAPPPWLSPALYGVIAVPNNGTTRVELVADGNARIVPIGANMAIRRTVVDRIGGLRVDLGKLDGSLRTGEDHEFFLRMLQAGYRGVYEPAAVVHHWVPAARLSRQYFRDWQYQNGRDVARLGITHSPPVPRLLRIPRYLWRQAAGDLWTLAATPRAGEAHRFRSLLRLVWLTGHVRETWFGVKPPQTILLPERQSAPSVFRAG